MAERLSYTKGHLSAVENGVGRPSKALVESYERVLGLASGELTQPEEEGEPLRPFGRRASPISERVWDLLERAGTDRERDNVWEESQRLIQEVSRDPRIPAEGQAAVAGFIRAGLLWLKSRQET
jgi:hypothetical protein